MVYLIMYDLNRPGQDYSNLYEAIKRLGAWCTIWIQRGWWIQT
jgi:hypothetical protein